MSDMAAESIHDLTAAYALDALEPWDMRAYERHLDECERCRDELASFQDAVGALAQDTDAPPPPAALRERILAQARAERQTVVPLMRRRPFQLVSAAAGLAAAAAAALGVWGVSARSELDRERAASAQLAAIVGDPDARRIPLEGERPGTLVVTRSGAAAVVFADLPRAPGDKRYMAWVIRDGQPAPAGLFDSDDGKAQHVLDEPVSDGATVAVTVEDGPVQAPTGDPISAGVASV